MINRFGLFVTDDFGDLTPEFVETLILDDDIPPETSKTIWIMFTTCELDTAKQIATAFIESTDPADLKIRWDSLIGACPDLPMIRRILNDKESTEVQSISELRLDATSAEQVES